jgi:hypothetical protein
MTAVEPEDKVRIVRLIALLKPIFYIAMYVTITVGNSCMFGLYGLFIEVKIICLTMGVHCSDNF